VYFRVGSRLQPADLVFDGEKPILVLGWRTIDGKREPDRALPLDGRHLKAVEHRPREYIYHGELAPIEEERGRWND
jgi:hypothetical protein